MWSADHPDAIRRSASSVLLNPRISCIHFAISRVSGRLRAYAAEQGPGRVRHLPTLHIPPDRTLFVYPVIQVARVVRVEHRMRLQDLAPEVPGVSIEDDDIIAFSRREHAPVNRSTVGALA